ncbi:MAG: hypothetical protein ACI8RZ_006613 [Myxococcota bacterium]
MNQLLLCVLGLLGCTTPDSGALYREAAALPPQQAQDRCAEIREDALQGECLTFTAAEALTEGDEALAADVCGRVRSALWQEECAFLLADRGKQLRGEAVAGCAATGRFQGDCISHALERDFKLLPPSVRKAGAEQALLVELIDMARHYGSGEAEPTGELLLAHIIARRVGPGPLHHQACGEAPVAVCQMGFLIALSIPGRSMDRVAACQPPRTVDSVAAAGVRPWTDDAQEPAVAALDVLCSVVEAGGDASHLGALLGAEPAVPMGTHFLLPPPWMRGVHQVPWDDGI